MPKVLDLIGQRFGKLEVIKRVKNNKYGKTQWLCKCDCGNECVVTGVSLTRGDTKSCGCYHKERMSELFKKHNEYYTYGETVFVKFSNCNEYFLCDLEDWNALKDQTWAKDNGGYAMSTRKKTPRRMHDQIMDYNISDGVDHIFPVEKGVCDNRKNNLRVVSLSQNQMNSKKPKNNSSGFKGVNWRSDRQKWRAFISYEGKFIALGLYENIEDAIKARKEAEIKYFGEYRRKEEWL